MIMRLCLQEDPAVLGLLDIGAGRIGVYGDSNCLDSSHMVTNCYWLLKKMLDFTSSNIKDPVLFSKFAKRYSPVTTDDNQLPSRRTDVNFSTYSSVIGKELVCESDSRFEVWGTKGYNLHIRGRNRRLPGYRGIDLGRGLNVTVENTRSTRWMSAREGDDLSSSRSKYLGGLFNRDEVNHVIF